MAMLVPLVACVSGRFEERKGGGDLDGWVLVGVGWKGTMI